MYDNTDPTRGANMLLGKKRKLRKGWNQDAEAKKVGERARGRAAGIAEAERSRVGQLAALAQRAQTSAAIASSSIDLSGATAAAISSITSKAQGIAQKHGGVSAGKVHNKARYLSKSKDIYQLARRIEKMGYEVGELEGWEEDGQITSGHTDGSFHYSGQAMDITGEKLNRLWKILKKSNLPIDEAFFRNKFLGEDEGPVSGHDNHIHLALMNQKGWVK